MRFTAGVNRGRDDFYARTDLTLDWEFIPARADFSAGVVLERNASDLVGRDFSVFDIGQAVGLTWKF